MHSISTTTANACVGDPAVWLERLLEAATPASLAMVITDLVQSTGACERAAMVWWPTAIRGCEMSPQRVLEERESALIERARHSDALHWDADTKTAAWRLGRSVAAVLVLQLDPACERNALRTQLMPILQLAGRQLQRTLELEDLKSSHEQLRHSGMLQRALFAIADLASAELEMRQMLRSIHDIVGTLMYAENFFIVRYDAARGLAMFLYFADLEDGDAPLPGIETSIGQWHGTSTWHLLTNGKPLMGTPQQLAEQVGSDIIRLVGPDSCDWLGVPMQRESVVYGALVVQSYREGVSYTREDCAVLSFVASHILTALDRRQSKDELEQRVARRTCELADANRILEAQMAERQRAEQLQAALFQLAQLATAALDEQAFYGHVHDIVGRLIKAQNFYIALVDADAATLRFAYVAQRRNGAYKDRPLGRGPSEYVLSHGAVLLHHDQMMELVQQGRISLADVGDLPRCWMGVPLWAEEQAIGLVAVQSWSADLDYTAADLELLGFVASQIVISLQRRRVSDALHRANAQLERRVEERTRALRSEIRQRENVQQELRHQVMHDPLTGLPNRDHLRGRIDSSLAAIAQETFRRSALLYLDLDRFKVINDSLGHLAGDAVLKQVAVRLNHCARANDLVARLSGDEFVILLDDHAPGAEPADAAAIAQRVLDTLAQPMIIFGRELQLSASVGVAMADRRYQHADELLRDADIALYRAKARGRKRYEVFDDTLARTAIDELTMEGELRHALQGKQFEPYLQPIVCMKSGRRLGYEALIRWNHPQRGVLLPGAFLQAACDSGQIEAIDWQLFELACQRLARLADTHTFVTLNVSALHLSHADFDQRLLQMVERTALAPQRVVVEVTEDSLLDDPELVRHMLERLRQAGVGAALDDFGTGYSSLSYLNSLPLRLLKIDRAFVQALDNDALSNSSTVVSAILALARALDIKVIAEGIETPVQHRLLQEMGCEAGQGFLLDRPAPIEHWLAQEQSPALPAIALSMEQEPS